jgi:hypothetical protein
MHERLHAEARLVRAGVEVREQADHRRAGRVARERGGDEAVRVDRGVGEPEREQLGLEQPRELELARRAGRLGVRAVRLGVDADVALEPLEHVGGELLGER